MRPTTHAMPKAATGRCRCGGRYSLEYDDEQHPQLSHSVPVCARYEAVQSSDDAVRYSEENRGVS